MFDIGIQELIVIFIVALFVVGPEKLPELATKLGKMVAQLRRSMADVKSEVDREINAAKYVYKEHEIPTLKGDHPYTLKTEHRTEEPDLSASAPPPIDGEPAHGKDDKA